MPQSESAPKPALSEQEILQKVREVILVAGMATAADINTVAAEQDLFDTGLLDSISIIGIILGIEKKFNLQIPTGDFEPSNFRSLQSISRLIARRLRS